MEPMNDTEQLLALREAMLKAKAEADGAGDVARQKREAWEEACTRFAAYAQGGAQELKLAEMSIAKRKAYRGEETCHPEMAAGYPLVDRVLGGIAGQVPTY
ncbi:hypothetical protein [Acidiphilium sp.]|uniref:hypothetical protein n=1 Tax=Acidiphilium sp. TaxID=527 RepID=UPI00258B43F6|nr:hypothetical protein [Acidiphilium sp.]